jgi:hypothetical protein
MKASLDFGSKTTWYTVVRVLGAEPTDWGFSFGDTVSFELLKDGNKFSVRTLIQDGPYDLTPGSTAGILPLDKWSEFIISKMYYGTITELQKDSGAENPDNHIIRDTADSETPLQWWANQRKYEDRVFLKQTLDTTALDVETIDRSAGAKAPVSSSGPAVTRS